MDPLPATAAILAITATVGIAIVAAALLAGWRGWLALRRLELERGTAAPPAPAAARIELADLRERVRKLEAIAAGVDL